MCGESCVRQPGRSSFPSLHQEAHRFYAPGQFEPSPPYPLHLLLLIKDAKASVAALQGEGEVEQRHP